jgi:pectinesterase
MNTRGFWAAIFTALLSPSVWGQTNLYVAADGSAAFSSVQQAIMAVPSGSRDNPVIIHIAPGTYRELIYIQREKQFFKLVGQDAATTILSYNLYAGITNEEGKPIGTFKTPSTTIDSDDFTAENLTFENAAGPVGQALAIRVDGDRAKFQHCRFLGWQDTILLNRGRQYFDHCHIAGHVDFIFGASTAWFEACDITCLGNGYVTAASTPADQAYGFVFSHCKIQGSKPGIKTFLGRPWRIYASTIYLNCDLSDVVNPQGWFDWKKPQAHQTARYAEYASTGPGANPAGRPDWTRQLTPADAEKITVAKVLGGEDHWDPVASVETACGANHLNVKYGEAAGEQLLLDAHVPAGQGPYPVLIMVHGGGWSAGDKETDIVPVLARAVTNFTWFTINYRLAPTNRWPACFEDEQTAIRWVKKHAAEYRGDPDRIAIIGYSAGGHLATLAGTLTNIDTRVQAVAGFAPPTEIAFDAKRRGSIDKWLSMKWLLGSDSLDATTLATMEEISPVNHLQPGLPPYLLVQGSADTTVPFNQTKDFADRLKAAGVSCDLITIQGGPHRIRDWERLHPGWEYEVADWLQTRLAEKH